MSSDKELNALSNSVTSQSNLPILMLYQAFVGILMLVKTIKKTNVIIMTNK